MQQTTTSDLHCHEYVFTHCPTERPRVCGVIQSLRCIQGINQRCLTLSAVIVGDGLVGAVSISDKENFATVLKVFKFQVIFLSLV